MAYPYDFKRILRNEDVHSAPEFTTAAWRSRCKLNALANIWGLGGVSELREMRVVLRFRIAP
jgi:hypothetical protein